MSDPTRSSIGFRAGGAASAFSPPFAYHAARTRRGLGLLEVIICTGLVAVMIVPLAAVIRASATAIARTEADASMEADLRRGLSWLGEMVSRARVMSVRPTALQLQLASGDQATVRLRRGELQLVDGDRTTTIASDVRGVQFRETFQRDPPNRRSGITVTLSKRDPKTRAVVTVDRTIALRTQY